MSRDLAPVSLDPSEVGVVCRAIIHVSALGSVLRRGLHDQLAGTAIVRARLRR